MKFTYAAIALFAAVAFAEAVPPFDPSGAKNVGNGVGKQFIGGQCLSQADCASGCCANPTGICSGPGASTQNGKTGCGFGGAAAAAPAAGAADANEGAADAGADSGAASGASEASAAPANGGPPFDPSGAKNVGNGAAKQFIGGQCLGTADCASGCCAGPSGICSGPGASTQNGKTGCGFESGKKLLRF